jgi:hypothetical protein
MSPGYGNRFYKPQKKKPTAFILVFLIIAGAVVLFYFMGNKESNQPDRMEKNSAQIEDSDAENPTSYEEADESAKIEKIEMVTPEGREPLKAPIITNKPGLSPQQIQQNLQVQETARKGVALYNQKQFQQALDLFNSIEGKDPHVPLYMGLCHYQMENYESALVQFRQIISKNNSHFMAKKYLALTYYHLDDLANSLHMTDEALSLRRDRELLALKKKLVREQLVMKEQGYMDSQRPNFKIQFSKFEHNEIKEIVVDILNNAHRTISSQMNFYPSKVVTVILYNEKSFFDITRAPGWAGGLYDGKIRVPVKGAEHNRTLLERVLYHEYTHALVHAITRKCPLWLNEGLAEYFSNRGTERIGQVIPLMKINSAFRARDPKVVAVAYLESYSAVSILIEKYGLYRIKELLEKMADGQHFQTAFRSIYYIPFDKFLREWQ